MKANLTSNIKELNVIGLPSFPIQLMKYTPPVLVDYIPAICPECKSRMKKYGKKHTIKGERHYFECKNCGQRCKSREIKI